MILYRPVGLQELELIYDNGMKAFPARLPQQPIFYPVLTLEYARQIASDWNAKSGQSAGYVTQFKVEDEYIAKFEQHTVGGSQHQEFWIPAEELEEFNRHIAGHIKVVEGHFGDGFQGFIPEEFGLQGKDAVAQLTLLANSYIYNRMDFYLEIKRNHKAVFLNYPFWQQYDSKNQGLKKKVLQAIREVWLTSFPKNPLPLPVAEAEETPLAKQTDSQSLANPVDEDTPFERPTDSRPMENSVYEDVTPAPQTDARSSEKPVHEEAPLAEQTESRPLVRPVHEELRPIKQTAPHFLGTPVSRAAPPRPPSAPHFSQGLELGLSGKYDEAVGELSKAVEENPNEVVAQTSLGVAFHRLGQDDRAVSCYEAALKIDPRHAEAHYFRANILYARGEVREAIAGYTIALGLEPDLIEAHQKPIPQDRLTDYTRSPAEMYRIARAAHRILDLNKSLESTPNQANLFKERAVEYYRLWNDEQAIADYSSALAIQPDDAAALHSRGLAYEQMGQLERALKDYQQAIALNPNLSAAYINRGITFGNMGNFRQSLASLTEGIRLAPKNADGYFNRGMTYFRQGDLDAAIADFSTVIQLSAKDEDAYYWRGISYEEAGRPQEAIADYRQFLAISENPRAREEIEQRLAQWSEGKQDDGSRRSAVPGDRQKTDPAHSAKSNQNLDLYDVVVALGERALQSIWFGSGVDCSGEKANELQSLTEQNKPIEGRDFLQITSGIRQTTEGEFYAFERGATSHWILIRAWKGSGFYMETNDSRISERLRTRFPSIEEVEGAAPPYAGLFVRI